MQIAEPLLHGIADQGRHGGKDGTGAHKTQHDGSPENEPLARAEDGACGRAPMFTGSGASKGSPVRQQGAGPVGSRRSRRAGIR